MMRLYLSDMHKSQDLWKAGSPPSGGGRKGPSMKLNLAPKTPGAATGGSGPQVVDCPLGGACPDGGRHQMGSKKLQQHTKQVQSQAQTGQKLGDESTGKDTSKPGVSPGTTNLGGLGSDQVEKPQPQRTPPPVPGHDDEYSPVTTGEFHTETVDVSQEEPKGHPDFSAREFEKDPHGAKTRSLFQGEVPDEPPGPPPLPQKPPMGNQVAGTKMDRPGMETKNVPNPMVPDEANVPPNSKPMDHYKLSQVARESGDEELAGFHENMARKRTEGMGSEDHRKLAEDLNAAGMHEQAKYHTGIHERVGELEGKQKETTPEQAKKQEESMRDVHHEQRTKATSDLEAAKKKHEETKAKADKIKASNEEKLKKYEEDKAAHEKAKADAKTAKDKSTVKKVGKPPQKPKLDKEEKVPEKPDLYEPENDADKLRHEGHTDKAKRLADLAESHIKGNKNLTPEQKSRLERAHKMAVYHSNIGYTPTAAHKKELGDVESAISGMGIKQSHEEMTAAENAKKTAEATKQAEKDRAATEKQQAKQAKMDEKAQAQEAKQQAKMAGQQPQPPETDLDHARVADHKAKAQELRDNVESHMAANPDMSPDEKTRAEHILSELEKHEQLDMVPGSDHEGELKELQKLAGAHGKKKYEPEGDGGEGGGGVDAGHNFAYNMLHQGRALGATAAAAATNPYGQAGQLGSAVPSYAVSGATSAGHHLLRDEDKKPEQPEKQPQQPPGGSKRPQQSSMKDTE